MQLAEFIRLVDAYGAEAERWPPRQRAAALALAQSDAAAQAVLREAEILDRMLDAAPDQAPSFALRTAVARAALDSERRGPTAHSAGAAVRSRRPPPGRWAAAAALAAACAAGAVTGVAAATRQAQPAHAAASADPAVDAARLLADPVELEG